MTEAPRIETATSPEIRQDFASYQAWKLRVIAAVERLGAWFQEQGHFSADTPERLQQAVAALREDRLTIAFVGEFSRGKTELINAIFFAGLGRRLLPSTAGRTTMCPTEILWDAVDGDASLRLLPIETRAEKTPVSGLKRDPRRWVRCGLDPDSPIELQSTLKKLTETKRLPLPEAEALGFSPDELDTDRPNGDGTLEVPRWRHALISFPHPLLKQGLVVLDTPGLNALGSEPELTLSMLPSAQAVLFVLAADTGVTRSDLEIWQHHIKGFQHKKQALAVVLNKVDVLWDDLLSEAEIAGEIDKQQANTAKTLGLGADRVFPVSAQKALIGRVKQDPELLSRSCLEGLERYLSSRLLENKYQIILDNVETSLGNLIETNQERLSSRLDQIRRQRNELDGLRQKSKGVIVQLLRKTRDEQRRYIRTLDQFQGSRRSLLAEAGLASRTFRLEGLDDLIRASYREMVRKATTRGISSAMGHLFDELRRTMQTLTVESERLRRRVLVIYDRFEKEHGFTPVPPKGLVPMRFRTELELLCQEADAYRKSSRMLLVEQNILVRRFFEVLVTRVRGIFERFASEFDGWLADVLEPLRVQIQERKEMMEKRLENLRKISRSKGTLDGRLQQLDAEHANLTRQLSTLLGTYATLRAPPPSPGAEQSPEPNFDGATPPKRILPRSNAGLLPGGSRH